MTLEEFYNAIGGNSNNILNRINDEFLVKKFIVKFLDDSTFEMLKDDILKNDIDKANFDAHTLKGVCAVLEFIHLKEATEQLVSCLKQNKDYAEQWQSLEKQYNLIIKTIKQANWQ